MPTLWNKGYSADEKVSRFTVGNDPSLDLQLAPYDIMGSLAHIQMLHDINLLSDQELSILKPALEDLLHLAKSGDFVIEDGVEDVHSQVELLLTRRLGDVGKKIHSGRSRNDQVLVDLKLYFKDVCLHFACKVFKLFEMLQSRSEEFKDCLMPGYTHEQMAMPSSAGLWLGAYAETLIDDVRLLEAAYRICDQNPLGSAAGYGSSFPLDREQTTRILGFADLHYNSIAAQLSRGKCEQAVAYALSGISATLNKLAADNCLFICNNLGFISYPDNLTTGSSIMPHKKNPDVWELIRAKCNCLQSLPGEISMLCTNLSHGYHRDFQILKDIMFPAFSSLDQCLDMSLLMLSHLSVKKNITDSPMYDNIFTVEEVNRLVIEEGLPFRDAYRKVADSIADGSYNACKKIRHCHTGSIGNLATASIRAKMLAALESIRPDWDSASVDLK